MSASSMLSAVALSGALSLAATAAAVASDPDPVALAPADAVRIALAQHPSLAERRARIDEREHQIAEAYASVYPAIDAKVSAVRSRDPGLLNSPNFSSAPDLGFDPAFLRPIPVTTYDYRLVVDQLLYSFGKVARGVEAARLAREGEALLLSADERAVARDAMVAYWGLARARARAAVLVAEREALESQVRRAEDFLEAGAGTRLQVLQSKAALANLRPRELAADADIRAGRARLNEAIGRDPTAPVDVDPARLEEVDVPALPTLERLLEAAGSRPDLAALAREREVLDRLARIERASTLPEIRFTGSYGSRTIDTSDLGDDPFASWDAGVYFEWSLFDGHAGRSRARRYEAQRGQNEARTRAIEAGIARALVVATDAYEVGLAAARSAEDAVREAEEARRVAEEENRWGAATALDVLEAERTLRSARLLWLEARHDALVALEEIRFQVGRLPTDPPVPEEPS